MSLVELRPIFLFSQLVIFQGRRTGEAHNTTPTNHEFLALASPQDCPSDLGAHLGGQILALVMMLMKESTILVPQAW